MSDNLASDPRASGAKNGQPEPLAPGKIRAKATLACPSCGYKKVYKNVFDRDNLDMLVVSSKVMAWMACDCGELIEFSLEFDI